MSQGAPFGAILAGATRTDAPSLHTLLEVLLEDGPRNDLDGPGGYFSEHECFYLHGEQPPTEGPNVTPPDLSPMSHATYLWEKSEHLNT